MSTGQLIWNHVLLFACILLMTSILFLFRRALNLFVTSLTRTQKKPRLARETDLSRHSESPSATVLAAEFLASSLQASRSFDES